MVDKKWGPSTIVLPIFQLSPEEMFLNKLAMLDVNFINPNKYNNGYMKNSLGYFIASDGGDPIPPNENGEPSDPSRAIQITEETKSIAMDLQETVAKWYIALRNLAILMLLCILIYIGIRMVISSSAGEKSKYKEMLVDWVVAMCLVFCLHYIMAFALNITENINKLFQKQSSMYLLELPSVKDYTLISDTDDETAKSLKEALSSDEGFVWPTNLMGKCRIEMQTNYTADEEYDYAQIGYTIVYLVLIIYTIMFLFIYLKRVLYMAFLTLIAPLVAMTYPLDKLHDGKAQAFNMWFKEYIFTLLIQPVHALIYTVFVSMAIDFASKNVIYTLVCIGFILQAEKIIRKFFGFEKAGAFPIMNSALGGAMVMQGVNMLRGRGNKRNQEKTGGKGVRTKSSPDSRGESQHMDAAGTLAGSSSRTTPALEGGNNQSGSERTSTTNSGEEALGGGSTGYNSGGYTSDLGGTGGDSTTNSSTGQDYNQQDGYDFGDDNPGGLPPSDGGPGGFPPSDGGPGGFTPTDGGSGDLPPSDGGSGGSPLGDGSDSGYGTGEGGYGPTEESGTGSNTEHTSEHRESLPDGSDMPGRGARIKGYVKTAGKYALGSAGSTAINVLNGVPRVAMKLPLAAALGTIGVAAGLASDNGANVVKYGAAGAGVGYAISNGKPIDTEGIKDQALRDTYGDKYKEYMNQQSDKAFMKDQGSINDFKEAYGKDYKKKMEIAKKYRENGITDNNIIIKAMKAPGNFGDQDSKERIALAKLASQVSATKDLKEVTERLKEKGASQGKIKETKDAIRYIKGFRF